MTIYSNALSGLLAARNGLSIVNQNVANLKTEGYSRRGITFSTLQGGGVDTSDPFRHHDDYRDRQLWQANTGVGEHDTAQARYADLEVAFGGDVAGQPDALGVQELFSALHAASRDPVNDALRGGVIDAAKSMAQRCSEMANTLRERLDTVERQRSDTAGQLTALAAKIAGLNREIVAARVSKQSPNALLDTRTQAIDALSRLAGVQVLAQRNGAVDVSLAAGGQPLVVGDTASTVGVARAAGGLQHVTVYFAKQTFEVPGERIGGALGGLNDFEANGLRPQMHNLTQLMQQFAQRFNAQLATGYDAHGQPGKPLFVFDPATARLHVDTSLRSADLAFSADRAQPADTANLLKLIDLKDATLTLTGIGTVTFGATEAAMIGTIGAQSRRSTAAADTAGRVREQADSAWKSVSSVNYDEEATDLVEYQQMYQANMKCIAVSRTLFETVLQAL